MEPSEGFTNDDLDILYARTLSEITRRLGDPKERAKLTAQQLMQLERGLAKLSEQRAATPAAELHGDLDFVALVARLPPERRREYLVTEQDRLLELLRLVHEEMNEDDELRGRIIRAAAIRRRRRRARTKSAAELEREELMDGAVA